MGSYAEKLQSKATGMLQPGEQIVSAIRTQPRGTNTAEAAGGLIADAVDRLGK